MTIACTRLTSLALFLLPSAVLLSSPSSSLFAMAAAASTDVITLTKLDIEPAGPTPIDSPIKLNFQFSSQQELPEAFWEFKVRGEEGHRCGQTGRRSGSDGTLTSHMRITCHCIVSLFL